MLRLLKAGAQISLAEVSSLGERSTSWYNLLNYKDVKELSKQHTDTEGEVAHFKAGFQNCSDW